MRPTATNEDLVCDASGTRSQIGGALAALAFCYSLLILFGWWFRIGILQRIVPGAVPIHPHTAVTFVALSLAVWLCPWNRKWQERLAMLFAVLALVMGGCRVLATVTGDSLWVGDPLPAQGAAVMAVSTAVVFLCLGVACLCLIAPRGRNWTLAIFLGLMAMGTGCTATFGHLFKVGAMYALAGEVMALPTAILTILVGAALVSSRPPVGVVASTLDRSALMWFNLPIRYKCMGVLALPIACLTFEIGWQLQVLRALDVAQQWTTHTQQVELGAADLQRLLLQIESNDRGYGLSGSDEFLTPLARQEAQVGEITQRLIVLVEDNPKQLARARNLAELSRIKLDVARDVTAFFATHPAPDRSTQIRMRLLESKARMDEFMELSRVFLAEEDRLLAERVERLRQQQQLSHRVLVLTLLTGIGTGLLGAFLFSWSIANRLSTLKQDSLRMATGELMPPQEPGDDEISELALSLKFASFKIHDQMKALEALNHDLESFSYSVSHDLRSPLRHIHGFSKILRSDFAAHLPAEAQRYLSRIENGAERMGQLIDDLLNFSRIGRRQVDRQSISLLSLVQNVVDEVTDNSAGKIDWHIGPLPTIQGDPGLIKQVLANLLGNAVKFTRTRERPRIEVGSRELPQGTAIYVRDNGVGFDMRFADKLFGVFQRLHRLEEFEGTGVGLASVARIVHKHGGTVWAESAPDQGATFYFTLGGSTTDFAPQLNPQVQDEVLYAAAR